MRADAGGEGRHRGRKVPRPLLAAGLALVLATTPAGFAGAELGEESCGGLAPLANNCQTEEFHIGKNVQPFVSVLGAFLGEIELRLKEEGDDGEVRWTCSVFADPTLPAPLSGCSAPQGNDNLEEAKVRLFCTAKVYRLLGQKVAGPAGSWTCGVLY